MGLATEASLSSLWLLCFVVVLIQSLSTFLDIAGAPGHKMGVGAATTSKDVWEGCCLGKLPSEGLEKNPTPRVMTARPSRCPQETPRGVVKNALICAWGRLAGTSVRGAWERLPCKGGGGGEADTTTTNDD